MAKRTPETQAPAQTTATTDEGDTLEHYSAGGATLTIDHLTAILRGRDPAKTLRLAFDMYLNGLTQGQTAKKHGMTQPAVSQRLARLNSIMESAGITTAALRQALRDLDV